MYNFISFGSGSSGNCYYLFTENEGLLIDVGIGTRALKKHFRDYGLRYVDGIDNILITHDHADHIKSVGSLSKSLDIPVWATSAVHSGIDRNYCVKCKLSHANRRYIEKGKVFDIGNFTIKAFDVPHDSSDNVGYQIVHNNIVFTLLTDVGRITEEMKEMIRHSNYLVIESNYDPMMLASGPYPLYLQNRISQGNGHLCNLECARAIVENYTPNLRHVWLCHLSQENNTPEIALNCLSSALENAGIKLGHDLKVDVLRRKLATGIFSLE